MEFPQPTDLGEMDYAQLHRLFKNGDASPVEVAVASLKRIDEFNPVVNAFSEVTYELALNLARQSEERWLKNEPNSPIDGIPITIKELTPVIGVRTRRGSTFGDKEPSKTEPLPVARLRRAGGVILGTTTSPEFGWKGVTHGPATGVTLNPWDVTKTSGGSSGGAAVAAALNMGILHDGSDGAGSIRIPASFCGVVGMKPTYNWSESSAVSPFFELAHRGPLSRKMTDAAQYLDVTIATKNERASTYHPSRPENWSNCLEGEISGLKIGLCTCFNEGYPQLDVKNCVYNMAQQLEDMGCIIQEVELNFSDIKSAIKVLWSTALSATVDKMGLSEEQRRQLDPGITDFIEYANSKKAIDYVYARQIVQDIKYKMEKLHVQFDVLLTPTMPITAFAAGHDLPPNSNMGDWMEWSPFTYVFNMTGQPAASIPCGFDRDGLPVGAQIIGPWFMDDLVMRLANAYQTNYSQNFPRKIIRK